MVSICVKRFQKTFEWQNHIKLGNKASSYIKDVAKETIRPEKCIRKLRELTKENSWLATHYTSPYKGDKTGSLLAQAIVRKAPEEIVLHLLQNKYQLLDPAGINSFPFLSRIAGHYSNELLGLFLDSNAQKIDLNKQKNSKSKKNALHIIAKNIAHKDKEKCGLLSLQHLLTLGAHPNVKKASGDSALSIIAQSKKANKKNLLAVELLIEWGADVNTQDNKGNTPLHHVAQKPYPTQKSVAHAIRFIDLLISQGARSTEVDNKNQTPFDVAQNEEIKRYLKSTM